MASTYTSAKTFPRLALLKIQFETALRRLGQSEETINFYKKLIDKNWLKKTSFYALDNDNYCLAQLDLTIDWDEHGRQIFAGKTTVAIGKGWENNTAPELITVIKYFNEFVSENHLTIKRQFTYKNDVNAEKANQELGLDFGEEIQWKQGNRQKYSETIRELPELKVGLQFIE